MHGMPMQGKGKTMKSGTFAQVGDLAIHYDLADYTDPWRPDEPETFLLYSGYCRNIEFWRAWVLLLGRDYRVLRMDPRGFGQTTAPPPGSEWSVDALAGDAIGLMDALGIARVHWVGEFTGGAVGLAAAARHPSRFASLTLINTPAKPADQVRTNYAIGEADQAAAIEKYGVAEWCRRTLPYRMDVSRAPAGMVDWVPREMGKTPTHVAVAAFRLFGTLDLRPLLPGIEVPTLLVVGSKCTAQRKQHMTEMRDAMPCARLIEIDGYDHGLNFLVPDAVVAGVREFLSERHR